jgi:hypothetical protein
VSGCPGPRGGRRQSIKTFATTTGALLKLLEWLVEQQVDADDHLATGQQPLHAHHDQPAAELGPGRMR